MSRWDSRCFRGWTPCSCLFVVLLVAALLVAACGSDDDVGAVVTGTQALGCSPGTQQVCACLGGATGMQRCNVAGTAYGACEGCPAPVAPPAPVNPAEPATPTGGVAAPPAMPAPVPPPPPSAPEPTMMPTTPPTAGAPGAGTPPQAGGEDPLPVFEEDLEGPSCGVGLPKPCRLGSEICCVRSLAVDTCIPAGQSCTCDLPDCDVIDVACDGPEDCDAGQVCCGTLFGASYRSFACAANCDYRTTQRIACHQENDECPAGNVCSNSQLLTNIQVCIDPATIEQ